MRGRWIGSVLAIGILIPSLANAQRACANGIKVVGVITDPTGAVIPGATVNTANVSALSDTSGHYTLRCVAKTAFSVTAQANGFSAATLQVHGHPGSTAHVDLQLALASVQTDVQVHDDPSSLDVDHGMGTRTLGTDQIQQLADDPDDFLRELQTLASAAGGNPMSAMIRVDGFQNGAVLPPKSSIASVRVAPDLFSAEYQFPPFDGAQIEISTKPGADRFHGALFFTDSDSALNATDPLSVSATPAGKRRYGAELTGPIVGKNSSFAIALEKRDIDEFNIVKCRDVGFVGQAVSGESGSRCASALMDWVSSRRLASNAKRQRGIVVLFQREQSLESRNRRAVFGRKRLFKYGGPV